MKKISAVFVAVIILMGVPAMSQETVEFAAGMWSQNIDGEMSYTLDPSALTPGVLYVADIEDDLGIDDENRAFARLKADLPLLPGVYLGLTPMEFSGDNTLTRNFEFGDYTFEANQLLETDMRLNHLDVGLYYSIPFLNLASLKKINVDLGLICRIAELDAEVRGTDLATGLQVKESEDYTLPIPMLYGAVQITPVEKLALELECMGISLKGNHLLCGLARLKYYLTGPLFLAGGYRYDDILLDEEDIEVDFTVSGFFVETGLTF